MRCVLHVGPVDTPGGMSKVIQILADNPPDGWAAETLDSHSTGNVFAKIRAWYRARKFIKNNANKYDIIHFHSAADFSFRRKLNLANYAEKLGKPILFHIHSGKFDSWAKKRKNIKYNLKPFTIAVLSDYWRQKLEPIIGICEVVNNPINPHISKGVKESRKKKQLLLLGRPDPVKGHEFAFEIARKMRLEGWELLATGTEHCEPGIRGLGWVSEERKNLLLQESTVLLVPSKFEGQPMVMLEAMSAGCQIIASEEIPELPNCVHSASLDNSKSWVESIQNLTILSSSKYLEKHSIEFINQKWAELYSRILTD